MGGSEAELTLIMKAKNLASREVDKLHRSLGGIKGAAGRGVSGLLSLAKTAAFVAGGALLALGAGILFATKRAAEEEKGIARMTAALKANAKGFNGNIDVIEKVIREREKLAFSDDSLRASLTTLVTKYKDVDKALKLQTTAMDLARLKGISLEDASVMLTKGLDGNAKILKQLGIELPKTATEQERLTAIQKVAAGQAEAYGKTSAGAQEAFRIALDDVIEDVGSAFLPIMTQAFTFLTQEGIPAVRGLIASVQKWYRENKPLIDQVAAFVSGAIRNFVDALQKDILPAVAAVIKILWDDGKGPLPTALRLIAGVFKWFVDTVVVPAIGWLRDMIQTIKDAIAWLKRLVDAVGNAVSRAGGGIQSYLQGTGGAIPGMASGGWVGLHGPEVRVLGEEGPEFVRRAGTGKGDGAGGGMAAGFVAVAVSEKDLARMVDEKLYFTLRRAAPTSGRI